MLAYLFRYLHIKIKWFGKIKLKGIVKIGKGNAFKAKKGTITLGKKVTTRSNVSFSAVEGAMNIGDRCFFNNNCTIACRKKIDIGRLSSFGPGVVVVDHDHVIGSNGFSTNAYTLGEVVIGENCWIGANSVILKGTHLGDGCVVAAGTVVKGSIPAHSLVKMEINKCRYVPLHD